MEARSPLPRSGWRGNDLDARGNRPFAERAQRFLGLRGPLYPPASAEDLPPSESALNRRRWLSPEAAAEFAVSRSRLPLPRVVAKSRLCQPTITAGHRVIEEPRDDECKLSIDGREFTFPIVVGSEDERGIDISTLRSQSGAITLDPGYGNTGACDERHHVH